MVYPIPSPSLSSDSYVLNHQKLFLTLQERLENMRKQYQCYAVGTILRNFCVPEFSNLFKENDMKQMVNTDDDNLKETSNKSKFPQISENTKHSLVDEDKIDFSLEDIVRNGFCTQQNISTQNMNSIEGEDRKREEYFYKQLNILSDCADLMEKYLTSMKEYSKSTNDCEDELKSCYCWYFKDTYDKEMKKKKKEQRRKERENKKDFEELKEKEIGKSGIKPLKRKNSRKRKRELEQNYHQQCADYHYDSNSQIPYHLLHTLPNSNKEDESLKQRLLYGLRFYHFEGKHEYGKNLLYAILFNLLSDLGKYQNIVGDKCTSIQNNTKDNDVMVTENGNLKQKMEFEYDLFFRALNTFQLGSIETDIYSSLILTNSSENYKEGKTRGDTDIHGSVERFREDSKRNVDVTTMKFIDADMFSPGASNKHQQQKLVRGYNNLKLNNLLSKYKVKNLSSSKYQKPLGKVYKRHPNNRGGEEPKYQVEEGFNSGFTPNNSGSNDKIDESYPCSRREMIRKRSQFRLFLSQLYFHNAWSAYKILQNAIPIFLSQIKSESLDTVTPFLQLEIESNKVLGTIINIIQCKLKNLFESCSRSYLDECRHKKNSEKCFFDDGKDAFSLLDDKTKDCFLKNNNIIKNKVSRGGEARRYDRKMIQNQIRVLSLFVNKIYSDTFNSPYSQLFMQIHSPSYPQTCISKWHKDLNLLRFHIQFTLQWSIQKDIMMKAKTNSGRNQDLEKIEENNEADEGNSQKVEIQLFHQYLQYILLSEESYPNSATMNNSEAISEQRENFKECTDPGNIWLSFKCSFEDSSNQQKYLRSPYLHNLLTTTILENYAVPGKKNSEPDFHLNSSSFGTPNLQPEIIETTAKSLNSIRSLVFLWNINKIVLAVYYRAEHYQSKGVSSIFSSSQCESNDMDYSISSSLPSLNYFSPIEPLPFLQRTTEIFLKVLTQQIVIKSPTWSKIRPIACLLSDILEKLNIVYIADNNDLESFSKNTSEDKTLKPGGSLRGKNIPVYEIDNEDGDVHNMEYLLVLEWIKQYSFVIYDILSGIILFLNNSSFNYSNEKVVSVDYNFLYKLLNVFLFLSDAIFLQDRKQFYQVKKIEEFNGELQVENGRRITQKALHYLLKNKISNQQDCIDSKSSVNFRSDLLCNAINLCPLLFPILVIRFYSEIEKSDKQKLPKEEEVISILQGMKLFLNSIQIENCWWWYILFDYFRSTRDGTVRNVIGHDSTESITLHLQRDLQLRVLERYLQNKKKQSHSDQIMPLIETYIEKCKTLLKKENQKK